jgi:WD40 repeat protein
VFTAVAFSPDGKLLATGGGAVSKADEVTGEIKLWDVGTRKLLCRLDSYLFPPVSVAFSPDGKILAGASLHDGVKLWYVNKALKQKPGKRPDKKRG